MTSSTPPTYNLLFIRMTNLQDNYVAPPRPPVALGTLLFPRDELTFGSEVSIPQQMKLSSLSRQRNEYNSFYGSKHPQFEEFRDYYGYERNLCTICSEYTSQQRRELAPIYHAHHSTLSYRIHARLDRWGQFFCPTCTGGFHAVKSGVRYPLLITSSTLSSWRGRLDLNNYQGDPFHLDEICIPGSRIRNLMHAFQAEYSGIGRPVDIILVAGINNILEGQEPEDVMNEIKTFRREVMRLSGSSFAVATLPFPPCLSILPEDQHTRVKRDATDSLKSLNTLIRNFNRENAGGVIDVSRCPLFHTWGLRSVRTSRPDINGPRHMMEYLPAHNPAAWREQKPQDQLHLTDRVRLRMGRAILRYFKSIYDID